MEEEMGWLEWIFQLLDNAWSSSGSGLVFLGSRSPPFIATKGSNSVILPSLFPLFSPTSFPFMNSVRPRHMGKEPICGFKVSVFLASSQRGEEPPAFLSTFPMQAARTMEGKGAVLYSTGKPLTPVDFFWFFERVVVDSPG
ncbi:hypothetical protein L3X38_035118 [Prunus dulcis]|uniref:Uncharacterized protein n=1 Tax=Prunus dulcis TaxID=3755 RepID=A0AAD4VKK6_PRUDU|nr:hypothetical protein L3X38_035118 [Prunus dulcis]